MSPPLTRFFTCQMQKISIDPIESNNSIFNLVDGYSSDESGKYQHETPDILPIIRWLKPGDPDESEIRLSSPATKYLCAVSVKVDIR